MGLREFKKDRTRRCIAEMGKRLFLEHGYAKVTVADVAQAAEISVTTVFNYFPTKESILFDREPEISESLIKAVKNRKIGVSVIDSLRIFFLKSPHINGPKKDLAEFLGIVRSAPELMSYYRSMWNRYEKDLAREIHQESKVDKMEANAVARLLLEGVSFAGNSTNPQESLNLMFQLIKNGWDR